jgi:hypothetical protein
MKHVVHLADLNRQSENLRVEIESSETMLLIKPEGYGDFSSNDGDGAPIALELVDGNLHLIVWDNINQEDPTDMIGLMNAKESNRIALTSPQ